MRHFADSGYQAARVEDIATALGIAKGSIFQRLREQAGAVPGRLQEGGPMLPGRTWTARRRSRTKGFFEIIEYWLGETPHLVRDDWIPTASRCWATTPSTSS